MNRRGFCTGALTALSAAGSASAGQVQYRAAGANAADKDIRRTQLFLDDTWVDDTMRLQRTETHCYRLSVRFVELANIYRFQQRFLWVASQPMQALARETESVVHLGQLHGRDVLELVRARPCDLAREGAAGVQRTRGDWGVHRPAALVRTAHARHDS